MPAPSPNPNSQSEARSTGEEGFLLIGAIVMIALIVIALAVAAPRIAQDLRRQKEIEAIHRGNGYVRAIQLYYRKFGRYPGSMDQLVQTNNIRFLRQKYSDPITGQDDFAIIPVGQNKTTVKTFFGAPLTGLPGTTPGGVGSISNMLSPGLGSTPAAGPTTVSASGATAAGATGTTAAGTTPGASPTGTSGFGSSPLGGPSSGGLSQPFMGVALGAKGDSVTELNGQTDYGTWEFLYDPRLDQLKARAAALNGGGPGSIPGSSLGQPNMPTGITSAPTAPAGGTTTTPTAPTTSPTGP